MKIPTFTLRKYLALILIITLVGATSIAIVPKKAEASSTTCIATYTAAFIQSLANHGSASALAVPSNSVGSIISDDTQTGGSWDSFVTDCIEHGLALGLGKMLMATMTNEIVQWVNSGFAGNPAFVTNPQSLLSDISNNITASFIGSSSGSGQLSNLCSPFQAQVQQQLAQDRAKANTTGTNYAQASQCTLSNTNALSDFNAGGGWDGWMQMTQSDNNNPYGAYLDASEALDNQISSAQSSQNAQLNWGHGFLSYSECQASNGTWHNQYDSSTYAGSYSAANSGQSGSGSSNCTIETPGSMIETSLASQINEPAQQIGMADDLDKIMYALVGQIFQTLISGQGGLLGSTNSPGSSSYGDATSALNTWVQKSESEANQASTTAAVNGAQGEQILTTPPPTSTSPAPQQNVAIDQEVTSSGMVSGSNAQDITNGDKSDTFDGDFQGAITAPQDSPWLQIDLGKQQSIDNIIIYQDTSPSDSSHGMDFTVQIIDNNNKLIWESPNEVQDFGNPINIPVTPAASGRYIRLQGSDYGRLQIAEVEVYKAGTPSVTVTGSNPLTLTVGQQFVDPGATAIDDQGNNITQSITTSGTVDTSTAGTYTVTYTATDANGTKGTATREVIVESEPGQQVILPQ